MSTFFFFRDNRIKVEFYRSSALAAGLCNWALNNDTLQIRRKWNERARCNRMSLTQLAKYGMWIPPRVGMLNNMSPSIWFRFLRTLPDSV